MAAVADTLGPGCEALGEGWMNEPVAAVSSLAFVVAAAVIVRLAHRHHGADGVAVYAALVAGVGIGSLVQHGPDPWWSGVAHDVPLMATLAFVAADGVADLRHARRRAWWWLVPSAAVVPAALTSATVSTVAQSTVAVVAIAVTLVRAWHRPALRRPILTAVALLALGSVVGTLSRAGGPWCDPHSLWQGHAVWHVLASAALVTLTPTLTTRRPTTSP